MHSIKKALAFILAAVMMLPLVTACSNNAADPSSSETETEAPVTKDVEPGETEEEIDESVTPLPSAPAMNMDDRDVCIYVQQWGNYYPLWIYDVVVEDLTGEGYNDAAYYRNTYMHDTLNCNVTMYENTDIANFVNSVTAADNAYDFIIARGVGYPGLITSNVLLDISNLTYFDPENRWWDANSIEPLSVAGKKFGVVGDTTENLYLSLFNIYFNKQMVRDYNFEDIYDVVREGRWTIDLMYDLGSQVAEDLDGDNQYTTDDKYGFTYISDNTVALLNGLGVTLAKNNEEGGVDLTLVDEDTFDRMDKLMEVLSDKKVSLNGHVRSKDVYKTETGMFIEGRVLFNVGALYYAPEMRAMDQEFGIIPYPKYDEAQENYLCPTGARFLAFNCIPKTCQDFDSLSTFMEYYAYYGYDQIRPQMFEILIQGKVARDVESIEFLNYIFDNKFYDTGMIFDYGGIGGTVMNMYGQLSGSIATLVPRMRKVVETSFKTLQKAADKAD